MNGKLGKRLGGGGIFEKGTREDDKIVLINCGLHTYIVVMEYNVVDCLWWWNIQYYKRKFSG